MISETPARRRIVWCGVIALLAAVSGALGGLGILWANSQAQDPVVGWLGEWIKSPGFAGLGAVVAASIAFVGIFLQLNANRERDADAGWWQSFEWASDRGLPRSPSELRLSFEAALDALNALATAARTDIQKNAVSGVVDELLRAHQVDALDNQNPGATDLRSQPTALGQGEPSPDSSGNVEPDQVVSESDSGGAASAVLRYALQQVGTAAESRRVSASAYEAEVLKASRHQYETVFQTRGPRLG